MKSHRRKHTSEFKVRVTFEAVKGLKTMSEIAAEYVRRSIEQLGNVNQR